MPLKFAWDRMDSGSTCVEVRSYRLAANLCGTTSKTIKRIADRFEAERAVRLRGLIARRLARRDRPVHVPYRQFEGQDLGEAHFRLPAKPATTGRTVNFRRFAVEEKAT